jgi:flagellar biosynthetic protein FliR
MQIAAYLSPIAIPFMLVLTRITGIFIFTPLLSSSSIPRRYKAMLAVTLSAAVFPMAEQATLPISTTLDLPTLGIILFSELLVGVVIGLIASMPIIAVQMGGFLMGYQMGLGLAQTFNPEMEGSDGVVNQLMFTLGISVYLSAGGLELILIALLSTFDNVPTGSFSSKDIPLDILVGMINSGIDLAIRLAAPVMGVIMLSLISMGFVMKTMPQINILSVGFAAKILSGLSILVIALGAINIVIHDEILASLEMLIIWAQSIGQTGGVIG